MLGQSKSSKHSVCEQSHLGQAQLLRSMITHLGNNNAAASRLKTINNKIFLFFLLLGQSITHCVKLHKDNANGRTVQVDNINIFLIEESLFADPVIPGPKSKYVQYIPLNLRQHILFFSISITNYSEGDIQNCHNFCH